MRKVYFLIRYPNGALPGRRWYQKATFLIPGVKCTLYDLVVSLGVDAPGRKTVQAKLPDRHVSGSLYARRLHVWGGPAKGCVSVSEHSSDICGDALQDTCMNHPTGVEDLVAQGHCAG